MNTPSPSNLEPKTQHAALVLFYCRQAVLLRVGSLREEHALVALGLLLLADAAGLFCNMLDVIWSVVPFARSFVPWVLNRCSRKPLAPGRFARGELMLQAG
jgi:hypothetical protein